MITRLCSIAIALCIVRPAAATVNVYYNYQNGVAARASWIAAAFDFTLLNLLDYPDATSVTTQYASQGITFVDGFDFVESNQSFADGQGMWGGGDEIRVRFSEPMHAIATNFIGIVRFILYDKGVEVYQSTDFFAPSGGTFAGLVSDVPFDSAVIVDVTGEVYIDDLYFGPPVTNLPPVIPVTRAIRQGQAATYGGRPITIGTLGAPFTDSNGQPGFVGSTSTPGESFVWFNDAIQFLSSDERNSTLSGRGSSMGFSDDGEFVYETTSDGLDAIYSSRGVLLAAGDPTPAIPGTFVQQSSLPVMTAGGMAYWLLRYSDSVGGAEIGRAMVRMDVSRRGAAIEKVNGSGDIVDGYPISATSPSIFGVSRNGAHLIQTMSLDGPASGHRSRLVIDGTVALRGGDPTGIGNNWGFFYTPSINDRGEYAFVTFPNSTPSLSALGINGSIVLSEGEAIDGIALGTSISGTSISNDGIVAAVVYTHLLGKALLVGDAADFSDAKAILQNGDLVDFTGDGVADAGVIDLNAANNLGPGVSFSNDGAVFIEVDLLDIGSLTPYEAILRLDIAPHPACMANIVQIGGSANSVDTDDLLAVISAWGPCPAAPLPCPANIIAVGGSANSVDTDDLLAVISTWGPCP